MDKKTAIAIIAGICILVLVIVLAKKYLQMVLNFLVRVVLGTIGILCVNNFLEEQAFACSVGINPATLLTVGILGFGGLILLYSITATKFL